MNARTGIFPVLLLVSMFGRALEAQFTIRSWLDWRTVETEHFSLHYPVQLEAWTGDLATKIESIDSAVTRLVGYAPGRKTDVVVDDPYEIANGSAWPYIGRPVINLWATPPDPREDIGEFRQWNEVLASHEFAHVAHLARPSRNALMRLAWALGPVDLGPIAIAAPRWVIEGYATFVEGRVTGSGRPHGTWRPAILRQWALEGQLPRYEQLDESGAYEGGSFAYLAGSAFLEWIAAQRGDSSLVDVWRRLSAKQQRTFEEAFTGVYGESARTLYGRFSAELTRDAFAVQQKLRSALPDTGMIVQRTAWSTGDPSISADGKRVALVLRSATAPSRVVIWGTAPEPDTSRARRDSLLRRRDPEDVPARSLYPPPKRALATLRAAVGSPYESPRFLRDGRLLLWRRTPRRDGSLTSDLYLWDSGRKTVRRVTHDASLREADPTPDGRAAVSMQCQHGWCDVVLVDLISGAVRVLQNGSPARSFFRPRVSPDGKSVVTSVAVRGQWRLAKFPLESSASDSLRFVGPSDGANRYDATFVSLDTMVVVSENGGIANLERIAVATGAVSALTHVTGAAVAPAYNQVDRSIWFLSLYSRGYDVRRIEPWSGQPSGAVAVEGQFGAAAPLASVPLTGFSTNLVSEPRPFGLRPRFFRWIPQPQLDADGASVALGIVSTDLIGRSEILLTAAIGNPSASRGASASFAWRGWRPTIRAGVFRVEQRPSAGRAGLQAASIFDDRLTGGELSIEQMDQHDTWASRYRVGASAAAQKFVGAQRTARDSSTTRTLAFGEWAVGRSWRAVPTTVTATASAQENGGESGGRSFNRVVGTASLALRGPASFSASGLFGAVSNGSVPFEQFALGGGGSPLFDRSLVSQRISMPALPTAASVGPSALIYRAAFEAAPFSWYLWSGSTAANGERFSVWHRVIGVEWVQSIAPVALAGTPAARVQVGVGKSLDAPFRNKSRAYVSFVLNP